MLDLPDRRLKRYSLLALSLLFVAAGVNHFVNLDLYLPMMPQYLPAHTELIYLSGLLEIAGGLAILLPKLRTLAGWFLVLLMLAVFPANIHMALTPEAFPPAAPVWGLWLRLPFQLVLIAWAWWATRPASRQ